MDAHARLQMICIPFIVYEEEDQSIKKLTNSVFNILSNSLKDVRKHPMKLSLL